MGIIIASMPTIEVNEGGHFAEDRESVEMGE